MIRLAQEQDIPPLRDIERRAGTLFAEIDMRAIAEDEPPSADTLLGYVKGKRAWVHVREDDLPVAYAIVDFIDGCAHIEQISVCPDYAGRRIGAGLIDHIDAWATRNGAAALTLTTFTDVPWNGPYYVRCGFRWLLDTEITPGLRQLRKAEAEHGLDRWPRGCMRRELRGTA